MDIGKSINVGCALFNKKKSELATHLGKSQVAISNYVNGHTSPSLKVVEQMAEFFGVSVSMMISWGE